MYIAPSSGEPLPNLNFPSKWILTRFEDVSNVWSENAKDRLKFIQIHWYVIMALTIKQKTKSGHSQDEQSRGQHLAIVMECTCVIKNVIKWGIGMISDPTLVLI